MSSLPPIDRLVQLIFDEHKHLNKRESRPETHVAPPLVTLTHDYGSGAEVIGRALAKALGVEFIGDNVTHRHDDRHHLEALILKRLQGTQHVAQRNLLDYLGGSPDTLQTYRRELVRVLLHFSEHEGGVIVDRGAHVILRDRHVFRLRIVGSEAVCARRVALREGIDEAQAQAKVHKINQQRLVYLRSLVGVDDLDPRHFDLTLNTDHFKDLSSVHLGLLGAMRAMGLNTGAT
ncbi:MAG TPA: cytidylate kinase-like family protein [bacterium]|nr:cytidylate kinase-like family protein [bacterium]